MRRPFGYRKEDGSLYPNWEDLELLQEAKDMVEAGVSLRQTADWLNSQASETISHEGLKRRLARGVYSHGGSLLDS